MSCKLYTTSYNTASAANESGIQSNSKKIKKSSFNSFSSPSSCANGTKKKYLTKGRDEKLLILVDIESALRSALRSTFSASELAEMDLAELIHKTQTDEYNRLIQEVLINHEVTFTPSKKQFQLWRKKIKNWITMPDQDDERRGGVLVPKQIKPQLLAVLHEILDDMPCRDFERLQEELLPALEEMRQKAGLKIPKNMCSDHWWFRFIRKHPDLKAKWDSKPCPGRKNGGATPYSVRRSIAIMSPSEPLDMPQTPLVNFIAMKETSLNVGEAVEDAALSNSTEIESKDEGCSDLFGELPDDVFLYDDIFEHHKVDSNEEQMSEMKPSTTYLNTENNYSRISNTYTNIYNNNNNNVDDYFSFQSNPNDFANPFGDSELQMTNLLSPLAQPFWCQSPRIEKIEDSWMMNDEANQW